MKIQSVGEGLRTVLSVARRLIVHSFMYSCRLAPIDKNKIVIMNYYGGGFGDNGKAIAEQLHKQNPGLKIVWPVKKSNKNKLPDYCIPVIFRSIKYYYEMATAAVWVDNSRKAADIVKRKGQFYVQTWHGMMGLKKVEKDAEELLSPSYIVDAKHDSKMADLILSGCRFFTDLCKRAFWYDGEILECGSPRLDILFANAEETAKKVRDKLEIAPQKKIVLYAPTFRNDGNTDCYIQKYEEILEGLSSAYDSEWVFAVRLHPNISDKANFIKYNSKVINATSYPDLYELILTADIVISDYSSLMFDASIINKPVFLYAADINNYKAERGVYFELHELPFPLSTNEEDLTDQLKHFDNKDYLKRLNEFNNDVVYYENGTASETVAKRILEEMSK